MTDDGRCERCGCPAFEGGRWCLTCLDALRPWIAERAAQADYRRGRRGTAADREDVKGRLAGESE